MNILVTGISGRIGANLAKAFVEAGHEVRGWFGRTTGDWTN
ncbi:MAG: NAD-dependent epimerase/dehydratase family protein [Caldilineaceae bacterium]